MKDYKLCDIDFEVGDIVMCKYNDDDSQPYKVLSITPRIVDDSDIGRLHKLAFNVKNGDELNPIVKLKAYTIGGESDSLRDDMEDDGWDAEHFTKIDIETVNHWIEYKEEDIAEDIVKLNRFKKIKELVENSLTKK